MGSMWRNPLITAVLGLLVGFFGGYLMGQQQPLSGGSSVQGGSADIGQSRGAPAAGPESGGEDIGSAAVLMERVRVLERQVERSPDDYELMVELGNILSDLGRFRVAAGWYERSRSLRDDDPDLLTDLGICYREIEDPERAVALFDRAADLSEEHWQSRYNAAVVRLYDLNDPQGALGEIEKLQRLRRSTPGIPDLAGIEAEIARRMQ